MGGWTVHENKMHDDDVCPLEAHKRLRTQYRPMNGICSRRDKRNDA